MFARVNRWSKQAAICTLAVMRLGYFGNELANAVFVMRVAVYLCILNIPLIVSAFKDEEICN